MKLISEHREAQLELFKLREAEKNRLDAKLRAKLAGARRSTGDSKYDDDHMNHHSPTAKVNIC